MIDAVRVKFRKPIFSDDFPEKGMKAWLTDIKLDKKSDCYILYFDFSDFEKENDKYLKEIYYENKLTREKGLYKDMYTAKEAGYYNSKYSVYFGDGFKSVKENELELEEYLINLDYKEPEEE